MSNCGICGRSLSNPASIAAGVGPVCAGRNYKGRIYARHGFSGDGWSEIQEWEKVNNPCYSCKYFTFPAKNEELKKETGGFRVTMTVPDTETNRAEGLPATCVTKGFGKTLTQDFASDAIGGYCKALDVLVDGNLIKEKCACRGINFVCRKSKAEQPTVGLLYKNGEPTLFDI